MGRQRRTSRALEKAESRLQGLRAINPLLDLGSELKLTAYEAAALSVRSDLDSYNRDLALLDQKANDLSARERELSDLSMRMLAGVAAKFGKDSNEYEMAGGTRNSERKDSARAPEDKPAPPA